MNDLPPTDPRAPADAATGPSGLLDHLPVGLLLLRGDGGVRHVNPVARDLLDVDDPHALDAHPLVEAARVATDPVRVRVRDRWLAARATHHEAGRLVVVEDVTVAVLAERRSASLLHLAQALSRVTTRADVIRVVLHEALGTLEGAAGSVLLLDEQGEALRMAGHVGYEREGVGPFAHVPLDLPIPVTDALRSREAVFLRDFEAFTTRYPDAAREVRSAYVARAALPLVVDDRAFGALAVSFLDPRDFDDAEKNFLLALAHQSALALARADLFDRARQARALEVFAGFTESTAESSDPLDLAREAVRLVHAVTRRAAWFSARHAGGWHVVARAGVARDEDDATLVADTGSAHAPVLVGGHLVGVLSVRGHGHTDRAPDETDDAVLRAAQHALTLAWQRSEAMRQARAKARSLEEVNAELDAFASMVSHDLQTPVRHLLGFAGLLERTLDPGQDRARQHLRRIEDAARRMNTMIHDLLAFSRVGRQEMRRVPVPLGAVVGAVVTELRAAEQAARVEWQLTDLPVVLGDETLLRQVFENLLGNAVKFTRDRPAARVEVSAESGTDEVVVRVRDNGVGFDPRYQDRLFQAFSRLHPSSDYPGTGIGLANVRRIVERHGGRVWAQGVPGTGASFFVALPRAVLPVPTEARLDSGRPWEDARRS